MYHAQSLVMQKRGNSMVRFVALYSPPPVPFPHRLAPLVFLILLGCHLTDRRVFSPAQLICRHWHKGLWRSIKLLTDTCSCITSSGKWRLQVLLPDCLDTW